MDLSLTGAASGHLTYCSNIHAAEHWPDVARGLAEHLPAIKARLCPGAPMGVGIRLAASASGSLDDPACMAELESLLGDDFYIFTINGFPYGAFHGQRVKDGAYEPDWSREERLRYTDRLATQLTRWLPEGMTGSVSTVPLSYKPWLTRHADPAAHMAKMVEHLIAHVAHLCDLQESAGKTIVLALEPEPFCVLETIDETVAFYQEQLFAAPAVARLAALTGRSAADCEQALRTHLGVCYDVCHAAVEFEDPGGSIEALRGAGIGIAKLQLSSALRVSSADEASLRALEPFNEPVYLHQTMARPPGTTTQAELLRYADLDEAFADREHNLGAEWRSHFHVPIFLEHMQHFATTQAFLREILALHRAEPLSEHLEVETYTWDVLPPEYRELDLSSAIARELQWVRDCLQ
jgi:hypothetical protein